MKKIIIFSTLALLTHHFTLPFEPKISIITSVFKGDAFIQGFLEDITKQTMFHECELIMINANSPGNEEPIIKEYMKRYPNIVYKKLEIDPGIYGTWNIGIGMARAKIITNANLDDRLATNSLAVHYQVLQENPTIDLVYSDYYVTRAPNETFETAQNPQHVSVPEFSPLSMGYCLPNHHPMWRKRLHKKHGLFDPKYKFAGDHEMWLRAVAGGAQFKKIPGVYSLFYHNPEGLSTDLSRATQRNQEECALYLQYNYIYNQTVYTPQKKD